MINEHLAPGEYWIHELNEFDKCDGKKLQEIAELVSHGMTFHRACWSSMTSPSVAAELLAILRCVDSKEAKEITEWFKDVNTAY